MLKCLIQQSHCQVTDNITSHIGENGRFSCLFGPHRKRKWHQMEEDKEQFHSRNLMKELGDKVKLIESLKDQVERYEKREPNF